MTTITNTTVRTLGTAIAALMLLAISFAAAPAAHAADMFGGDSYDYSVPDYSSGSSYDYSVPDYTGGTSYDYSVPDYTSYGTPSYDTSGYGGSYLSGGGSYGYGGSYLQPASVGGNTNVSSSVFAPTNTCTAPNTCNTSYDDHSIFNAPTNIVTNPAPVVINNAPSQPVYTPVYTPSYQPVYQPYQQPIAYNQPAPYVSLSAVPYTGLDLGPWGTAAYWGFLILWCLGAAYLIVVKRVQNKLVSTLNSFLFGTTAKHEAPTVVAHQAHAPVIKTVPAQSIFSGIDPFIASQISRAAF